MTWEAVAVVSEELNWKMKTELELPPGSWPSSVIDVERFVPPPEGTV